LLVEANRIATNGLLHAQQPSGHFGCETISPDRGLLVVDYAPEAWWCCTPHCLLAIGELAERFYTERDGVLHVQFLLDAEAQVEVAGRSVGVKVTGGFPWSDEPKIEISADCPVNLAIHIPEGYGVDAPIADGIMRASVDREFTVPLSPIVWVSSGVNAYQSAVPSATDPEHPALGRRASIWRGCVLQVADAGSNTPSDLARVRAAVLTDHGGSFASSLTPRDALQNLAVRGHHVEFTIGLRSFAESFAREEGMVRYEFDEVEIRTPAGTPGIPALAYPA
jgi:hypothetical protein